MEILFKHLISLTVGANYDGAVGVDILEVLLSASRSPKNNRCPTMGRLLFLRDLEANNNTSKILTPTTLSSIFGVANKGGSTRRRHSDAQVSIQLSEVLCDLDLDEHTFLCLFFVIYSIYVIMNSYFFIRENV